MTKITDVVDLDKQGEIAVLMINNPPVNALSVGVRKGIADGVKAAMEDGSVKALGAATSAVVGAVFNALDNDLPRNAGSFRRMRFTYAEESVVAAPKFPHSCSVATTNVCERLVNITPVGLCPTG